MHYRDSAFGGLRTALLELGENQPIAKNGGKRSIRCWRRGLAPLPD